MIPNELPKSSSAPGWPQRLTDNESQHFVRLRDGKEATTDDPTGESCLYGLLMQDGYIDRRHQWIPVIGCTADNVLLTGGTWSNGYQLALYGQTPIQIPDEPVKTE